MVDKGCDNCYYTYFDENAYPCSLCIRGIERTDQWQPSKKTKVVGKHADQMIIDEMLAIKKIIDDGKMPQTETHDIRTNTHECVNDKEQTETKGVRYCNECKWFRNKQVCGRCRSRNLFAEADTPQTDCGWGEPK